MNRKTVISAASASVCFALAGFALLAADRPQFDAASVRINQSSDRASTRYDPSQVILHKASIKHLVRRAFSLPDYQVVWPSWVGAPGPLGYDVSVTFPVDTTPERLQLMFQDLLATRFGLAMHWETREVKAFEVVISKGRVKLREAVNPAQPTDFPKYSTSLIKGEWTLSSKLAGAPSGLTVGGFLEALNAMHILDLPLVDATGIQGNYDIDLTAPADLPDNKPSVSELLGALDRQLGLKATPKALPLRMLVIDHLEKTPTEN